MGCTFCKPGNRKNRKAYKLNTDGANSVLQIKTSKFVDEYVIKGQLSQNVFREVRKVQHRATGQNRVVKIIKKDLINEEDTKSLLADARILAMIDHPNIYKLYEIFETKQKYYVVSEFLEGGELFERIVQNGHFSEEEAARIIKQVLSAVVHFQSYNIIHGDLRPENLVFESEKPDSSIKVIDFDPLKAIQKKQKIYYVAPEAFDNNFHEKSDVWSCGAILYILLSGMAAFDGKTEEEIIKKIKAGKYGFEDFAWLDVSQKAKNFIKKMMHVDINQRYSAEEALNDSWFKTIQEEKEIVHPLSPEKLRKIKSFRFESKISDITRTYLESYFSTERDKVKLLDAFKALDIDASGQLPHEDLKQGYVHIVGMSNELAEDDVGTILEIIDPKDGQLISYRVILKNQHEKMSGEEIKLAFQVEKVDGISDQIWKDWITLVNKKLEGKFFLGQFSRTQDTDIFSD